MEARQLVIRDLEGTEYEAILLRVRGDEADIVYLNDERIECDVQLKELSLARLTSLSGGDSMMKLLKLWRDGLKKLDASTNRTTRASSSQAPPTPIGKGRYVACDGSQIISHHENWDCEVAWNQWTTSACDHVEPMVMSACGAGLRGIRALREEHRAGSVAAADRMPELHTECLARSSLGC